MKAKALLDKVTADLAQAIGAGLTVGPVGGVLRAASRLSGAPTRARNPGRAVGADRPGLPAPDDSDDEAEQTRRGLIARVFTVFAAAQADEADRAGLSRPGQRLTGSQTLACFAAIGARVVIGDNRACCVPGPGRDPLPALTQFEMPRRTARRPRMSMCTGPVMRRG
jgi:hypothetical protein